MDDDEVEENQSESEEEEDSQESLFQPSQTPESSQSIAGTQEPERNMTPLEATSALADRYTTKTGAAALVNGYLEVREH